MFVPAADRKESRKRWLMSGASENKGELVVDEGAAGALTRKGSSLLPAGIVAVNGSFKRGDVVTVVGADGIRLAIGMTNYGSAEVTTIMGVHSRRIAELLGHDYGDEAIHRNNMLVL
jgi:glutamate 5-kinase